jgi:hypothetical protein
MADDVTAAALADLLDVLPDNVADLDPGIGWRAGAGSRIVLGETMAAPTVRQTRPRARTSRRCSTGSPRPGCPWSGSSST